MREIRFRAWDKDTESYVEHGFDFRIDGNGRIYRRAWGESIWDTANNLIIEQFTGLKDKLGKDRYASDIEKMDGGVYEIVWVQDQAGFFWRIIKPSNYEPGKRDTDIGEIVVLRRVGSEVIGNRWDTPELLTPKETEQG